MAIVGINYDCGCGYHARTIEEAIKHVDDSKHTLNVAGSIKSSEPKVQKVNASSFTPTNSRQRIVKPASAATPTAIPVEDKVDFSNLRAKLRKQ